jgi:hypothetical protein
VLLRLVEENPAVVIRSQVMLSTSDDGAKQVGSFQGPEARKGMAPTVRSVTTRSEKGQGPKDRHWIRISSSFRSSGPFALSGE